LEDAPVEALKSLYQPVERDIDDIRDILCYNRLNCNSYLFMVRENTSP